MALYLLYRGLRQPRYFTGMGERLGHLPSSLETTGTGSIWFHAVSVGEVLSIIELLRQLRAERPRVQLFVSTTTLTGRAMAEQKLAGLAHGVFYTPIDYRSIVRRVLRKLRPSLVVIVETEIWPHLYRESKRAGASLLVINGRISQRTSPKYERARWFFRHALCWADAILTQTPEDKQRYVSSGALEGRVRAAGNLKYDFRPPETEIDREITDFLKTVKPERVWIAASTMAPAYQGDVDEDDVVIEAFSRVTAEFPDLLLILAPRKPERFDAVAEKLANAKLSFVRRGALGEAPKLNRPAVLLLDSIGELAALFRYADVVFMGGTLAERGGHNILEPAFFAKPVIAGPHMENFAAIAEEFENANALVRIAAHPQLARTVVELLADSDAAVAIGRRAQALAESKRGVTAQIASELWRAYDNGLPDPSRTWAARVFFTPLSWIWRAGSHLKLQRSLSERRSLHAPVISIGGLTMGGTGKTPLVTHLAHKLFAMGRNPAVLTRGYKRRSAEPIVLVKRGTRATLDLTGDEAQLFIRSGDAHVGIARNRYEAGTQVEEQMSPDIFLLDDGFQHQQLARQQDVVVIDALDPFGGGVFPLGRSREPIESLQRATAIVITRADLAHPSTGLERRLRQINPRAPIFRSCVVPCYWMSLKTEERIELGDPRIRKVAGFCGLGNPRSFWATLDELGLDVTFRWEFSDHHAYRPTELARIAEQAAASGTNVLVTTEKDSVNLPPETAKVIDRFELYWLCIDVKIEREEELLRLLA